MNTDKLSVLVLVLFVLQDGCLSVFGPAAASGGAPDSKNESSDEGNRIGGMMGASATAKDAPPSLLIRRVAWLAMPSLRRLALSAFVLHRRSPFLLSPAPADAEFSDGLEVEPTLSQPTVELLRRYRRWGRVAGVEHCPRQQQQ